MSFAGIFLPGETNEILRKASSYVSRPQDSHSDAKNFANRDKLHTSAANAAIFLGKLIEGLFGGRGTDAQIDDSHQDRNMDKFGPKSTLSKCFKMLEKFIPSGSFQAEFVTRLEKGWFLSMLLGLIPPNADISATFLVDWFRRTRRASTWHTSHSTPTSCAKKNTRKSNICQLYRWHRGLCTSRRLKSDEKENSQQFDHLTMLLILFAQRGFDCAAFLHPRKADENIYKTSLWGTIEIDMTNKTQKIWGFFSSFREM